MGSHGDPQANDQAGGVPVSKPVGASQQKTLEEAVAGWDREKIKPVLDQADAERAALLERFPLEGWAALPLERYALGQGDPSDTWCRWIEFATPMLGSIKGG